VIIAVATSSGTGCADVQTGLLVKDDAPLSSAADSTARRWRHLDRCGSAQIRSAAIDKLGSDLEDGGLRRGPGAEHELQVAKERRPVVSMNHPSPRASDGPEGTVRAGGRNDAFRPMIVYVTTQTYLRTTRDRSSTLHQGL